MATQVPGQAAPLERVWAKSLSVGMAVAGTVAIAPLLWGRPSPWSIVAALIALLPYGLVIGKARWRAPDRSSYALAIGICAVMLLLAVLLLAITVEEWRYTGWRNLVYPEALFAAHLVAMRLAVTEFRSRPSEKPAWRLLLRGFIDPLVYYGIFLFLSAGASFH